MRNLYCLLAVTFLVFAGCKSTRKLFNEGNYDRALFSALEDLRKNPGNTAAAEILPRAWHESLARHQDEIAAAQTGTVNIQKLAALYQSYATLQKIYDAVGITPAARGLVSPKNYAAELSQAAENAAGFLYDRGSDYLDRGGREAAKQAYTDFRQAAGYVPGFRDVDEKIQRAYSAAVINVVVDKFDQRFGNYNVNGNFFQNDIVYNLNNTGNNYFYRFYSINEPRARELRVDQFMDINVYDIWFGQLAASSYAYNVSREITETDPNDPKIKKTSTVTATVNVTRRIIDSRAMMDYRITDAATRQMLAFDRIPAQYTWEKLTGSYNGDSRALSDKDRAIVNGVFDNQPGYDELYRELSRQLMNSFNNRMRAIYGR